MDMKTKNITGRYAVAILLLLMTAGCKKFLDEKPDQVLAVAGTVNDYQALMDKYNVINFYDVSAGDASSGETYLTDADYSARALNDQRMYTWENSLVYAPQVNDWFYCYQNVYYANSVIDGLPNVQRTAVNAAAWDNVLGQAYFIRGRSFLQAVGNWCEAYSTQASNEIGIPLRLNINFNEVSVRDNLQHSYEQVVSDLKHAVALLPEQPLHVMRASKPAAYALLARTYLWMGNYGQAALYADSCLQLKKVLLDYSTLTAGATNPIAQFNTEVLFSAKLNGSTLLTASRAKINPELYALYDSKDLRKTVYFKDNGNGSYAFKGSYDGSTSAFSGMAVDEVYLTRAECLARTGRLAEALDDLNALLVTRYQKGSFTPYASTDKEFVLQLILKERRKQLINRGLRWMDIKRLNREGAGITLTRTVNGTAYTLAPNSKRFAMPVPEDVVAQSRVVQNSY